MEDINSTDSDKEGTLDVGDSATYISELFPKKPHHSKDVKNKVPKFLSSSLEVSKEHYEKEKLFLNRSFE
jgi:hypothetical protein